jgi:hypothetical protein
LDRPISHEGTSSHIYNQPTLRYEVKPEVVTLSATHPKRTVSSILLASVLYVYRIEAKRGRSLDAKLDPRDRRRMLK